MARFLADLIKIKILPVLTAFAVAVTGFAWSFISFKAYLFCPENTMTDVLPERCAAPADEIYLIESAALNNNEYVMMTSLQGIMAQTRASVFLLDANREKYVLDFLDEHPEIRALTFGDPWALVRQCLGFIADAGCIVYEAGSNPTVNMAATVCGVERWLMVEKSLVPAAENIGLSVKRDLTLENNADAAAAQRGVYLQYRDQLCGRFILHQHPGNRFGRDYAIAVKAPCLFVAEDDAAGVAFRQEVFADTRANSMLFGWTTDEGAYVSRASQYGLNVIASDFCVNLSFMSAVSGDEPLEQQNSPRPLTADASKHYAAIVMSDGDNLQWFEGAFPSAGSHFQKRLALDTSFKMSWTAPPVAASLETPLMQRVYESACANDCFVAGVSGIGYINPSQYPAKHLGSFAAATGLAMRRADMGVVALLDNAASPQWLWEAAQLKPALAYYAQDENIEGGLIQSGDRYAGLGGKIYFSEGKPFISCALSFWYNAGGDAAAKEKWVEQFAAQLNARPADIHSAAGYTYVNVHPWSTSIEELNQMVSLLDGHVELVTAEELVALVKQNVRP